MKPTVVNLFKATGFAAFLALSACGGGGTVTGAAAKGIVKNGIVTVKNANGQVIGTGRTNNTDGSYSVGVGYEAHFQAIDLTVNFKYGGVRLGFDSLSDNRQVEFLQVFFKASL
jgi:hypothetical protein